MNHYDKEALLNRFEAMDGETFTFVMVRPEEAALRDSVKVTFSEEAMEALTFQMLAWVGTRLIRATDENGNMPQAVSVVVTVKTEGVDV